jgi:hypothetical protein
MWVLIAVVVLLALLFALFQCSNSFSNETGGAGAGQTAAPPAAPATGAQTAPTGENPGGAGAGGEGSGGAGAGGAAGSLSAGGTALLPVAQAADANGSLAGLVGQQVSAQGVTVQSVDANEGFWVGTSPADRVWVQLDGRGESTYTVKAGDRVSFTGQLAANPTGFDQRIGVDAGEGAEQLRTQAAHITVPVDALQLAAG